MNGVHFFALVKVFFNFLKYIIFYICTKINLLCFVPKPLTFDVIYGIFVVQIKAFV